MHLIATSLQTSPWGTKLAKDWEEGSRWRGKGHSSRPQALTWLSEQAADRWGKPTGHFHC